MIRYLLSPFRRVDHTPVLSTAPWNFEQELDALSHPYEIVITDAGSQAVADAKTSVLYEAEYMWELMESNIFNMASFLDPSKLIEVKRLNGTKSGMKYSDVRLPSWLQKTPEETSPQ